MVVAWAVSVGNVELFPTWVDFQFHLKNGSSGFLLYNKVKIFNCTEYLKLIELINFMLLNKTLKFNLKIRKCSRTLFDDYFLILSISLEVASSQQFGIYPYRCFHVYMHTYQQR
jgi:hypothetical protein